ncbi:hypothetical protein ACHAXT_000311 [Thalassiosira profunda]
MPPPPDDDAPHEGTDSTPPPKPTASEVHACQFSSWYPTFRGIDPAAISHNTTHKRVRKNVTIESKIIRPLPRDFIVYLQSDGVRLPSCATRVSSCMNDADNNGDDRWDSSDEEGEADDDGSTEEQTQYSFPQLTEEIQSALTSLGGERNIGCLPKLNWSAPKDAAWMNCGSLKCTKPGDVYLLLKSSDFVGFDLEKAWEDLAAEDLDAEEQEPPSGGGGTPPEDFAHELVLRKWCNLHPSMEFRCFVHEHELVAVSQRHPSKFYAHLQPPEDGSVHPSVSIIHSFFHTYIRKRFADGNVPRYVVDLYVDSQERAWLVDFNVWAGRTDGLLFEWGELIALGEAVRNHERAEDDADEGSTPMPEMRVVTKDMKSMTYDPLSSYRGPTDAMDLMNGGNGSPGADGSIPNFEEFMQQCVRPSEM